MRNPRRSGGCRGRETLGALSHTHAEECGILGVLAGGEMPVPTSSVTSWHECEHRGRGNGGAVVVVPDGHDRAVAGVLDLDRRFAPATRRTGGPAGDEVDELGIDADTSTGLPSVSVIAHDRSPGAEGAALLPFSPCAQAGIGRGQLSCPWSTALTSRPLSRCLRFVGVPAPSWPWRRGWRRRGGRRTSTRTGGGVRCRRTTGGSG